MDLDELQRLADDDEIDTVVIAFTDAYGRNMGKRVDVSYFLDTVAQHGSHACDYLFTVDMEMEPVAGYAFANWELGYGDVHLIPDPATLGRAAWAEATAIVLCDVADQSTHEPVAVAPRSILRRQVDAAHGAGLRVDAASELEFFLYDESYRQAGEAGYAGLTPAGWYSEDYHLLQGARIEPYMRAVRRALTRSGIPVETSKGETGRGQHELNIAYADVLAMADRHVVMKQAMKELADAQGRSVTFMAKPVDGEAGNSCHLHLSLVDLASGANAFAADGDASTTPLFQWFLGGWMHHLGELMVLYAPTVNSYKRYEDSSWAPTRIAWSRDNRTAGFRIVGSGPSLRIECRLPGADVNPYLAYAAAIASGLDGITNRIEPPEEFTGDAYAATDLPPVATSLGDAVEAFDSSEFARSTFGADVVDHYARFYREEARSYAAAVTDWERRRYFERI